MMNPINILQMLNGSTNPQKTLANLMNQQAGNNPVMKNALQMMEKGDNAGLEKLARNLCRERNINPDEAFNQIKGQFGIK